MFTIITPTYKRAKLLERAVRSLQTQTYSDWHLIVVNDSPEDAEYAAIEEHMKEDSRIVYVKNDSNQGVNYSRNKALDYAKEHFIDSRIMFLDDDDYFAPDCLMKQAELVSRHGEYAWLVTNRSGSTRISPDYSAHSYIWEWLITKQIKGDTTHCILFKDVADIRFSKKVKQGEEWIYFYQISKKIRYKGKNFLYHDFDATITDGYATEGLNFRPRSRTDRENDLKALKAEGKELGIGSDLMFSFYIFAQRVKLFLHL
jgi:glycosyltransferase involved in cell wall biosynthesis